MAFSDHAGPAVLATLVWGLIYGLASATNFLPLLIGGPLTGGYALYSLRLLRREHPGISDTFSGFSKFIRFLGLYWLLLAVGLLAALPALAGFGLDVGLQSMGPEPFTMEDFRPGVLTVLGGFITFLVSVYLFTGFAFAYLVSADGRDRDSAMGALAVSVEMARGKRIRLFGSFLLLGIFAALGFLVFFFGFVLTVPVAAASFASIYEQLSERETV